MDIRLQKIVMISYILLGFYFIAQSQNFVPPPNSPLANGEHPRLVFTDSKLQNEVSPYITNYESVKFQEWINFMDGVYGDNIGAKSRNDVLGDAMNYAFMSYAVHSGYFNNFSFAHSASEYASKAYSHVQYAKGIDFNAYEQQWYVWNPTQGWNPSLSLALIYDWCFNYLSMVEKKDIADELIRLYNQAYASGVNEVNYRIVTSVVKTDITLTLPGLTFYQDNLGSSYDNLANASLNMLQYHTEDRFMKYLEHMGEGAFGYPSGPSYTWKSLSSYSWTISCYNSAMGKNLFLDYDFLSTVPFYLFLFTNPKKLIDDPSHHNEPFICQMIDESSVSAVGNTSQKQVLNTFGYYLKNIYPDTAGFSRWFMTESRFAPAFNFQDMETFDMRSAWLWYKFLHGTKDVTPKSPDEINLSKSNRLGMGRTWLWSDYSTDSATVIYMEIPKFIWRYHANFDIPTINIFKRGNLWIDAGHEKSGLGTRLGNNRPSYPLFHNITAFYDGSEVDYRYSPGSPDGSMPYNNPDNLEGGANHVGTLNGFDLEGENYDFIDYDYTRTHKGESYADSLHRKVLYIRDPNAPNYTNDEYILIYEKLNINDSNYLRRFLIHTAQFPELIDGSWNLQSDGMYRGTGSILKITSNMTQGGNDANGRMFVKILEPSQYNLRMWGGYTAGAYRWFANADGIETDVERARRDQWNAFHVGKYRIEIEDNIGTSTEYFLVSQLCIDTTYNSMSSVQQVNAPGFTGALIDENRIAFFNRNSSPAFSLNYNFTSNQSVKHFITGMAQGNYEVKVNGNIISGINSSVNTRNGVLYFEYNGGGNFQINNISLDIEDEGSIINNGFELKQNYPNPFNPETIIEYRLSEPTQINLKIISIRGELVRTLVDSYQTNGIYAVKWDGKNESGTPVGTGIYFYQIETLTGKKSRKMLLVK